MKTKEELNALKNEVETLNKKLAELSEEELKEVVGGIGYPDPMGETMSDGWIKESSGETGVFYGIENKEGVFGGGSRLSDRWCYNREEKGL